MQSTRVTTKYCLDTLGVKEHGIFPIGMFFCQEGKSANQVFTLTKNGQFRREDSCAQVRLGKAIMTSCYDTQDQKWHLTSNGAIVNSKTGLCLDITNVESGKNVDMKECDPTRPGQKWNFAIKCS